MTIEQQRSLLVRAFHMARDSGKPDWQRMTLAVLKNRLLMLTNREFDEAKLGYHGFRDFLEHHKDVVVLGSDKATVDFVQVTPPTSSADDESQKKRVRRDLWMAVMDFSGSPYVWDPHRQLAVRREAGVDGIEIPTANRDVVRSWRQEFVKGLRDQQLFSDELDQLDKWSLESRPDQLLPSAVRRLWNGELKKRVVTTLEGWFAQHQLPAPDVLVSQPTKAPIGNVDQLRAFAIECIKVMTPSQLAGMLVPLDVALRARGGTVG